MRVAFVAGPLMALGLTAQDNGWHYLKTDPHSHQRIVQIDAKSFDQENNGHTKRLHDMTARLYDSRGLPYKQIKSKEAVIDEKLGTLVYGPGLKNVVKLSTPRS